MKLPHPIPYQGSKRNFADEIIKYFPEHINALIEPFAGSAAVSIAASYHNKAKFFKLNDINAPLMGIWEKIINDPETISKEYHALWNDQIGNEKVFYNQVRDEFNQTHNTSQLLYLLARCVKNAVRYNDKGEFNQGPDNRRRGRGPELMKREIFAASNLLKGKTSLFVEDYTDNVRRANKNDLIYMDPPYQGTINGSKRYIQGLDIDKFVECLEELNEREISYIISFDGRTGDKTFGDKLPEHLNLHHVEIEVGRSSQATLLGKSDITFESIYLSPSLLEKINIKSTINKQLVFFGG